MRAVLIDDEPLALELLARMLSAFNYVDIVGSYTDPLVALRDLKKLEPKVIFLDIEMGEVNGIEFVPHLMEELKTVEIVFTTAYSQYAVDAFEVNALDYLLKPIQKGRLKKTLERLQAGREKAEEDPVTALLRINSLGAFHVYAPDNTPLSWRTQKAKELFAYLWFNIQKPIPKSLIIDEVFPDKDYTAASTLLHTTIYLIRKNLRDLGCQKGITYCNDCYQLKTSLQSDVAELGGILQPGKYEEGAIKKALQLYRGDIFEREGYPWALAAQQKYRNKIFNFLQGYALNQVQTNKYPPTLGTVLDKMYQLDPFNEEVAVQMIHYLAHRGNKAALQNFFSGYRQNLKTELGLQPSPATLELYQKSIVGADASVRPLS